MSCITQSCLSKSESECKRILKLLQKNAERVRKNANQVRKNWKQAQKNTKRVQKKLHFLYKSFICPCKANALSKNGEIS